MAGGVLGGGFWEAWVDGRPKGAMLPGSCDPWEPLGGPGWGQTTLGEVSSSSPTLPMEKTKPISCWRVA